MSDTPLVKAVLTLLEVMSAEERSSVQQHMDTLGLPLTAKSGSVLRLVGGLFPPGVVLRVPDAIAACQAERPETSEKEVYNALGYLTRRHKIRRVSQGAYTAIEAAEPSHAR
ncbi:hypothetical protein [Methylobacterium sp. CCH5-D2]|uniref:hypothetical protein n=1 Tax=Methylobacterium sp. CCH5-D2 TaxID=1768765 RepID=UPI0008374F19|nr:hypothetical protein [Methylobacterium sp. CCH5-D2]